MLKSNIGRLRLIANLEGISLILLVFVAVPLKYGFGNPAFVKLMGPLHGVLFILFVFKTLMFGVEHRWKFIYTTWKVLIACMIPFGTFYIDKKILRPIERHMNSKV